MSIQWMAAVLEKEARTRGTMRLVLIALANHANAEGECWPSVGRIAREANCHRDTVRKALRELDD